MRAENNLADRSGRLIESRDGYDPRILSLYLVVGALLLILAGGLAYQQLLRSSLYHERERLQNQRRVLIPGPRGNVYDRNGVVLVQNRPRLAVVVYPDELQQDITWEFRRIRKNYRETGDKDLPTYGDMEQIARVSVAQRYLDQVDALLGRRDEVDPAALRRHFERQLLLPYTLLDDLTPEEFAHLIEKLPPTSPLQLYTSNTRAYPFASAAAHTLGYVGADDNIEAEDFPGDDLTTFKMKGAVGRDGLEKRFDAELQGQAGGAIYRVNPDGYRVNPAVAKLLPRQGGNLTTSLDVDLQLAAEQAIGDQTGAAVALDARTGEVLVMASKPDYDLNAWSPHLSRAARDDIEKRGAWSNRAMNSLYPPGSTFKIVVAVTGMLRGLSPDNFTADCERYMRIGSGLFPCENGEAAHGTIALRDAITESCDIFFYTFGLACGPTPALAADNIAVQARRFGLGRPSGIDLPGETRGMIVPDQEWKQKRRDERWFPGDTAHMAIGQGDVLVTPLDMACFAASLARGETTTRPYILHDPNRPEQHTEPIGLAPEQRAALLDGMERVLHDADETHPRGTAYYLTTLPAYEVPGVRVAGKTGTAQIPGKKDVAWFICFAPLEKPEIAVAVAIEGDTPGEAFGGGLHAAPVAAKVLQKYFEKKGALAAKPVAMAR